MAEELEGLYVELVRERSGRAPAIPAAQPPEPPPSRTSFLRRLFGR
jgi:hypothetical protein